MTELPLPTDELVEPLTPTENSMNTEKYLESTEIENGTQVETLKEDIADVQGELIEAQSITVGENLVSDNSVATEVQNVIQEEPKLMEEEGKDNDDNDTASDYLALVAENAAQNPNGGFQVLEKTQHLFIRQTAQAAELFVNAPNKFEVLSSSGDTVFTALETTSLFKRLCFGSSQPFDLSIYNAKRRNSLYDAKDDKECELKLKGKPGGCCTGLAHVSVIDPKTGKEIGSVKQVKNKESPKYIVTDEEGNPHLQIYGPEQTLCCGCVGRFGDNIEFHVMDGKTEVAKIAKQWSGAARELFTKSDIWGVKFSNQSVSTKAVLMAAVFLIDYQYFEG